MLQPLYEVQEAAAVAQRAAEALAAQEAADAAVAAQAAVVAAQAQAYQTPPTVQTYPAATSTDGLTGSIGYSMAGGNCVDIAHQYAKNQPGNPITWYSTTQVPAIGEAALFPYNHVAIVAGIWSDGSIEVYQANSPGMAHRLPRSAFRGFF